MRKIALGAVAVAALALLGLGCGVADDDFQAGNRLKIMQVANADGSTAFVLNAVEETNDYGKDNTQGVGDIADGENNGFPDVGETVITPLTADLGVITMENEPRLGVDPGVDLRVFQVDVTYRDANNQTPQFLLDLFPLTGGRFSQSVDLTITSGDSADLDFILVPESVKKSAGGLREIFLYGSAAQRAAVEQMTAFVDVYARDELNDDTVHEQARVTLTFVNPME